MEEQKHYHFINSKTGNKIAYFTIPEDIHPDSINELLENRRKELANEHGIFFETIYWEAESK